MSGTNTAKVGASLDDCLKKAREKTGGDSATERCFKILNLEEIKHIRDIPDIQNLDFWDYYKSLRWKYNSAWHIPMAIVSPIIYARFRHYQEQAKKTANR